MAIDTKVTLTEVSSPELIRRRIERLALEAAAGAGGGGTAPSLEAIHNVGGTGEPAFNGSWGNVASAKPLCFWKDAWGVVYIDGFIQNSVDTERLSTIFTLPVGYRPTSKIRRLGIAALTPDLSTIVFRILGIDINTDGTVATVLVENDPGASFYIRNMGLDFAPFRSTDTLVSP